MTKENRTTSSLVQGSHLHMAVKLLKGENANLEKIIILLKTENQNMQRRLKEMEYQNDRFKVTQNQLKTELKREKDMVRYLHNMNKKYERTLQKKEAESRQLRREARREEKAASEIDHQPARRPAPPQRSDSFKKNRDLLVVAALKEKEKVATSNTNLRKTPSSRSTASSQSSEDLAGEWEDVTDVLGFLNEKVNQFERLLMESGGSGGSGKSGYSSSDSMASGM